MLLRFLEGGRAHLEESASLSSYVRFLRCLTFRYTLRTGKLLLGIERRFLLALTASEAAVALFVYRTTLPLQNGEPTHVQIYETWVFPWQRHDEDITNMDPVIKLYFKYARKKTEECVVCTGSITKNF
jgi:hypothetical protein